MCQHLIAIFDNDTYKLHSGTGSHTTLISTLRLGTNLTCAESDLKAGPGKFIIDTSRTSNPRAEKAISDYYGLVTSSAEEVIKRTIALGGDVESVAYNLFEREAINNVIVPLVKDVSGNIVYSLDKMLVQPSVRSANEKTYAIVNEFLITVFGKKLTGNVERNFDLSYIKDNASFEDWKRELDTFRQKVTEDFGCEIAIGVDEYNKTLEHSVAKICAIWLGNDTKIIFDTIKKEVEKAREGEINNKYLALARIPTLLNRVWRTSGNTESIPLTMCAGPDSRGLKLAGDETPWCIKDSEENIILEPFNEDPTLIFVNPEYVAYSEELDGQNILVISKKGEE
jgi:hypothetical protein